MNTTSSRPFGTKGKARRVSLSAAALVLALAALIAACQNVLSIGGEVTVAPHPVDACGITLTSGACESCVHTQCCDSLSKCAASPACAQYETCLLGCGDDYACRAACQEAHPVGVGVEVATLDQCVVARCESACGVSCGLPGAYVDRASEDDCQACVVGHGACSKGEACGSDLDCQLITRCVADCQKPDCRFTCSEGRDGGAQKFVDFAFSVGTSCGTPCKAGRDWSCLGKVGWSLSAVPASSVTVNAFDSSSLNKLAGVLVRVCRGGDQQCDAPITQGTTDASGDVTLLVPSTSTAQGFMGYFELTAPGHVPTLAFLAYPLTEPFFSFSTLIVNEVMLNDTAASLGITLDRTRGHVFVTAEDCKILAAPGVVLSADNIDDRTQLRYVESGLFSGSAKVSDKSGVGMFFNAPTTNVVVHATPQAIGVESSHVSVLVRAGAVSLAEALPTP